MDLSPDDFNQKQFYYKIEPNILLKINNNNNPMGWQC